VKRTIIALVALLAIIFLCAGCAKNKVVSSNDTLGPNLTICDDRAEYTYVVDNRTGVVYMRWSQAIAYKGGLTVMLNPDGSPVMADDLGLEWKGSKTKNESSD